MHRRRAYASRNVGSVATVSALALIGLRPPFGSPHQYGISPHFKKSRDRPPVFGFFRMTSSSRRGVVAARHVREPAVPHVEPVDYRQPQRTRCLNNSSAHAYLGPPPLSVPC